MDDLPVADGLIGTAEVVAAVRGFQKGKAHTLLSVPGKVLCAVLLNRLWRSTDERLQEEQAGFRRGRSCIEQIFILRMINKKTLNINNSSRSTARISLKPLTAYEHA